jgi:hypothetical protein
MRLWSGKTKYLSILYAVSVISISACQISTMRADAVASQTEKAPLVDDKYTLTADRQQLDELRKSIPEEKKKENDELAFMSQLFADEKKSPSQVREKFDSLLRKKRELFQKDMAKAREDYTKKEKKHKDEFTQQQDEARNDFKKRKSTRDESSEFYNNLDAKRKEFYSTQRDQREAFESDMRDKRQNFDDYAREKSNEFNQELRAYTKRYEEAKKASEAAGKN